MKIRLGIIAGFALLASTALADKEPTEQDACLRDTLCRAQYTLARELSKSGRLVEALDAYEAAYQRRPMPILIFNMGRIHHRLEHFTEAIRYYSRYLEAQPPDAQEQRSRARSFMEEAMQHLQHPPEHALPPTEKVEIVEDTSPEPPEPPPAPLRLAPAPPIPIPSPARPVSSPVEFPPAKKHEGPLYKKWWLWTVVGSAVGTTIIVGSIVGATFPFRIPGDVLHPTK